MEQWNDSTGNASSPEPEESGERGFSFPEPASFLPPPARRSGPTEETVREPGKKTGSHTGSKEDSRSNDERRKT